MLALHIESCSNQDTESLNLILEATGALSISMMDSQDNPILEPAPGETPLWDHLIIQALYDNQEEANAALKLIKEHYPHLVQTLAPVVDQDWERVCLDQFVPQRFGNRLWICPSWHTPPEPRQVHLILDPGLAFGTGTHPTTALCLTWLDQATLNNQHLIDYGCGSGILALAALKLGVKHAYAVDIDPQALTATKQNASNNQITPQQLTITDPQHLQTQADILIANILLSPLLALRQTFYQLIQPNGILVVSGIFSSQADELIAAYQTSFMHQQTLEQEGWALIVFIRQN